MRNVAIAACLFVCCLELASAFLLPSSIHKEHRISLSTSTLASTEELESLTVKELRALVKDQHPSERGLLSKLKRKKDLVEFLAAQQNGEQTSHAEMTPSSSDSGIQKNGATTSDKKSTNTRKTTQRLPLKMPAKEPTLSLKDTLLKKVAERYPDAIEDKEEPDDFRQTHHPVTASRAQTDLDVVFLGTASCMPGITRGVSCTAVKLNWRRTGCSTWIFDVGECSQLQVQRTTAIKPSKISKIFLTHAHGDHTFGLPGLLCLMGQDRENNANTVIDIYGPEGIRMWLRTCIRYSNSRIVPPHRVHEIKDVPMAPQWEFNPRNRRYYYKTGTGQGAKWTKKGLAGEDPANWISQANSLDLAPTQFYGEVEGGTDIYPDYDHPSCVNGAPVWKIVEEEDVDVYAAPMSHGIPCVGYVVKEQSRPGRLRQEIVEPIVRRNTEALRQAGFRIPMKAMSVIKNLPSGASFTFPDGSIVKQEEVVEPQRKGRKVVICGDTCDASALRELSMDADVVVHEATNTYLQGIDSRESSTASVTKDAIIHGHSTPQIAGAFAKSVRAKTLILNHFSARYKGDHSLASLSIMMRIEGVAMSASKLNETQVAAAWDMMVLPVPASKS